MKKTNFSKDLMDKIKEISESCSGCRLCVKECLMLEEYCNSPKDLFQKVLETETIDPAIPYSCNMCNQCTIVCPKNLEIQDKFMEMRQAFVKDNNGKSPMKGHSAIEMHQLLSFSKMFTTGKLNKQREEGKHE
ncbi:4Fe-4S dicluster domain [Gottschalkia purinilytica]|uniref:4Fe-4S dicluster domain n=1 Tax=Gottschalkia purinilytica TaxID=1503 RepID=A0A0L0W6W2_GOTPU|nr:4Fe-4S dicluster domain-containing protein [Gottschalkia purinilytica]KNF07254.1 4Fe-4S dicluster domain [Gottschalkia purinilytica]